MTKTQEQAKTDARAYLRLLVDVSAPEHEQVGSLERLYRTGELTAGPTVLRECWFCGVSNTGDRWSTNGNACPNCRKPWL